MNISIQPAIPDPAIPDLQSGIPIIGFVIRIKQYYH
jgi:hypothetical protein